MQQEHPQLCVVDDCAVPDRHATVCESPDCPGCWRPYAADYMLLCQHHYRRAVKALHELPGLDDALTVASTSRLNGALSERVSNGSVSVGIQLDEAVVATKDSLREDLALFACYLIIEQGLAPLASQTVDVMVGLIDRHSLALAADPVTARAFAVKLPSARDDARRYAYPTAQQSMKLAACECGRALRYTRGDATVRCRGCQTVVPLAVLEERNAPDDAARFTAKETVLYLAAKLGQVVPEGTLRRWVSTGKLDPVGKDRRGRALYSPVAALALAQELRG